MTTKNSISKVGGGIESYLKRVFGLMTGAVGITALTTFIMLATGAWTALIHNAGLSATYYNCVWWTGVITLGPGSCVFHETINRENLIVFIFNLDGCCDYAYDFGIDPDIRYNGIVIGNNHVRMYDFVWI